MCHPVQIIILWMNLESTQPNIRASRRDALVKHYSDVHQTRPNPDTAVGSVVGGDVANNVVVDGIFDL